MTILCDLMLHTVEVSHLWFNLPPLLWQDKDRDNKLSMFTEADLKKKSHEKVHD